MKYRESFEVDKGYRFYQNKISILVQQIAHGRRLGSDQLSKYVAAINEYLNSISGRKNILSNEIFPLTRSNFPQVKEGSFYKYVSDETLEYIKRGLFQFGTAQHYRDSENEGIRDDREGMSTFHIGSGNNQLHASIVSGFNCAIFCGAADQNRDEELMQSRFGRNVLVIKDPTKFITHVCGLLNARESYIYDVVYTDLKNYVLELDDIDSFYKIASDGSLSNSALHEINRHFFQIFYEASFMPSMFSKPSLYAPERERRMIFEMHTDISTPTIIVEAPELLNLIEIIQRPRK